MDKWVYKGARDYYPSVKKLFGNPVYAANVKGGAAFWKTRGLFHSHLLRDENVAHCVPKPHRDFFYSSVRFYIPPSKLLNVLKISGSIQYDGLKKLVTARCGGLKANIATLYLAMCVSSGKLSIRKVKNGDLYAKHIRGEAKKHSEMLKEMNTLYRENHKIYRKDLSLPFYKLAFKHC